MRVIAAADEVAQERRILDVNWSCSNYLHYTSFGAGGCDVNELAAVEHGNAVRVRNFCLILASISLKNVFNVRTRRLSDIDDTFLVL